MSNTPRSTFPAGTDIDVRFVKNADNQHVAVDVWAIKDGGKYFTANLICTYSAPDNARWLIGSIACTNGDAVWGYRDDRRVEAGFSGLVYPIGFADTTFMVFQTKGKEPKVAYVVPLCDLLQKQEPQRPLTEVMAQKRGIAELLQLEVYYTSAEQVLVKHLAEQKRLNDQATEEAKRQQRNAERREKIDAILAREQVTAVSNGRKVTAIWVVGDEWKILPPRTFVIAGKIGDDGKFYPEETFSVFKEKGKEAQKRHRAPAGIGRIATDSASTSLPAPKVMRVVICGDQPYEVPTFTSQSELEQHRKAGLNGGALRGVESEGRFTLFKVTADKLAPEKDFKLIG